MKKVIISIVLIIIIIFSTFKQCEANKNHELIDSNPSIVVGKIEKYYESGVASYHMNYSYIVNFEVFNNEVIPKRLFRDCEDDKHCVGKPIYIRYYLDDPSISEPIYDSIPK